MAEGLNHVSLIGNLGADPDLKYTQTNQALLRLRLACAESYKDRDGTWKDRTEWVSVVVWGGAAEGLSRVLAKGRQVAVVGSLTTRAWDDRDGNRRTVTEVRANRVLLLGPKPEARAQDARRQDELPLDRGADAGGPPDDFDFDDIPF